MADLPRLDDSHGEIEEDAPMTQVFAAWSKDPQVLRKSTSGGIFAELSTRTLRRGGVVAGAAYVSGLRVEHRVVLSESELEALKGVKYLYGEIHRDVYSALRDALDGGREVLFSGLPCQCAAIRKLFGFSPKLILIDLVCFGAPSQKLWLKYVSWLERENGKRVRNIDPRDKQHGWGRKTYYRYDWMDGTTTRKLSLFDPYAQAFYSGLGFRTCCFNCNFRGLERETDITLGDLWGAEELCPELSRAKVSAGVSCVLVHTQNGHAAFNELDIGWKELSAKDVIAKNLPIVESPSKPVQWENFAADSGKMDFGELAEKYRLRIGMMAYVRSRLRIIFSKVRQRMLGDI